MTKRQSTFGAVIGAGVLASVVFMFGTGAATHNTATMPYRSSACSVPSLPGTTVHVQLMGMGMMGRMYLTPDRSTVPHGKVSFVAYNMSMITHELVVLPLKSGHAVGMRRIRSDDRVSERGSLGEASKTCGAGAGEGIAPRSYGWVTLTLPAARYELVCNLPGHYRLGMYALLTVN